MTNNIRCITKRTSSNQNNSLQEMIKNKTNSIFTFKWLGINKEYKNNPILFLVSITYENGLYIISIQNIQNQIWKRYILIKDLIKTNDSRMSFSEFSVGFDTKTKTLEFLNHILYKFNFIWSEKSENLEQNEWNQFELDIEKLFKENEDYDFSIQQKKEIMTKINQLISIWSIRCDEKDKKLKLIIVWCNSDEKYFDREKGIDFIWVENVYSDIILNMVIDISTFDWVLQPYQNLNALSIELKEDPKELSNKFFAYVTFPYHKKTLYTIESIKLYGEYYDRQGKQNYDSFFEYSKY